MWSLDVFGREDNDGACMYREGMPAAWCGGNGCRRVGIFPDELQNDANDVYNMQQDAIHITGAYIQLLRKDLRCPDRNVWRVLGVEANQ